MPMPIDLDGADGQDAEREPTEQAAASSTTAMETSTMAASSTTATEPLDVLRPQGQATGVQAAPV